MTVFSLLSTGLLSGLTLSALASEPAPCPWETPRDLLITSPAYSPSQLTANQQQADLACLKLIFEKQYAATSYFKTQGIDLPQRLDDWREKIHSDSTLTEFMKGLAHIHRDTPDRHLTYATPLKNRTKRLDMPEKHILSSALLEKTATGFRLPGQPQEIQSCQNLQAYAVLKPQGAYRMIGFGFGNASGPLSQTTCLSTRGKEFKLELFPVELEKQPAAMRTFSLTALSPTVTYARLPRTFIEDPADEKALFERLNASEAKHLIVDLRQNHGGSGALVDKLTQALRTENQTKGLLDVTTKESWLSLASSLNVLNRAKESLKKSSPRRAAHIEKKYQKMMGNFERLEKKGLPLGFFQEKTRQVPLASGKRVKPYPRKIALLVDKRCGSNCEKLLLNLYKDPNVVIVGTHTAGAVHFGEMGLMQLPHSKVLVYSGMRYFKQPTEVPEGVGYAPDYYLLDKKPVEVIQHWLETQ